jgi:hypothetical protein
VGHRFPGLPRLPANRPRGMCSYVSRSASPCSSSAQCRRFQRGRVSARCPDHLRDVGRDDVRVMPLRHTGVGRVRSAIGGGAPGGIRCVAKRESWLLAIHSGVYVLAKGTTLMNASLSLAPDPIGTKAGDRLGEQRACVFVNDCFQTCDGNDYTDSLSAIRSLGRSRRRPAAVRLVALTGVLILHQSNRIASARDRCPARSG